MRFRSKFEVAKKSGAGKAAVKDPGRACPEKRYFSFRKSY
jgi:hypothetical protein